MIFAQRIIFQLVCLMFIVTAQVRAAPTAEGALMVQPGTGNLLIYYKDDWRYVCNHGFDQSAAEVACAGLGMGEPLNYTTAPHGSEYEVWHKVPNCDGSENGIVNCDNLGDLECDDSSSGVILICN